MKRPFLMLLMFAVFATSHASTALIVHQKSGGTVEYAFSEKPVVTYRDGYLVISAIGASVSYPLSNMQKFTFGEVSDLVTRITALSGTKPQPTYIYNVGGVLVRSFEPSEDSSTPANLDGLPAGTYIIKNGKTSYKINKK
jgi:hypothetical protein